MLQYQTSLAAIATEPANILAKRARAIILKYSRMLDKSELNVNQIRPLEPEHKDLRQAVHLIDMTLDKAPKDPQHASLRTWLHYRKIRILVQFAPGTVSDAVTAMEREFPNSRLINDALAEQVYAEGMALGDVSAAEKTFQKLLVNYPTGNAVDNAYNWMALIYCRARRADDARKTNTQIIQRFPFTRHALNAAKRMSEFSSGKCS
jgi:TolA-binding protein